MAAVGGEGYAVFVADYRSSLIAGLGPFIAARNRGELYRDDAQDVVDACVASDSPPSTVNELTATRGRNGKKAPGCISAICHWS